MTIYFVRHGITFLNAGGQVQGASDSPLTDIGILQAIQVGKAMTDIPFITAYCGKLGRQRKTAQLILQQNSNEVPALVETVGFNEWNFGGFERKTDPEMWTPVFEKNGFTLDETWSQFGALYEKLGGDRGIADALAANDETGTMETYEDILSRAKASMDILIEQSLAAGGGNVLVVSSGSQLVTILNLLTKSYNGENIANCSVTVVKYANGVYSLEKINDPSYLISK